MYNINIPNAKEGTSRFSPAHDTRLPAFAGASPSALSRHVDFYKILNPNYKYQLA